MVAVTCSAFHVFPHNPCVGVRRYLLIREASFHTPCSPLAAIDPFMRGFMASPDDGDSYDTFLQAGEELHPQKYLMESAGR